MVMSEKWTKEDMEQWEWCQMWARKKAEKRRLKKLYWEYIKDDFKDMLHYLKKLISNIF